MSDEGDRSLQKIAKGSGIAFFGIFVGLIFAFIGRIMVARYGTEAEYGIFSLAFVILNICAVIGTLGLQQGATRSIAYARGEEDKEKVSSLVSASVQFGIVTSLLLSIIIFFSSDFISSKIFHDVALSFPLKIFALGIPFFTLINVFASIFRGFDDVKPKVYFQDFLRNITFPLFLLPVIFLSLSFNVVFYAFLFSLVVPCILFFVYAKRWLPQSINIFQRFNLHTKELLVFSLPLLGVTMLQMIISWTDTLMLGGLKTSADVGLYNAAFPLARFISTPLMALLLIYMPIISGLYAQGMTEDLKRNFAVLTKWLCSATFPLFLILFLFPELVLSFLFGANYVPAAYVLRILSLGFIINNFLGPNGDTLIAMGKVNFIMWATSASAIINIVLNFSLIPLFGILGAATASVVAITSVNLIRSWKLYSISKAQPLSKNLLKPTLISIMIISFIYFIINFLLTLVFWILPFLLMLFYLIYGSAIILTKSFDQEDITLLLAIEKKTGVNLIIIKNILKKSL
ncbi:MAG: flippase [Promethearchaeota archaeon]